MNQDVCADPPPVRDPARPESQDTDRLLLRSWEGPRDEMALHQLIERHRFMVKDTCQRILGSGDAGDEVDDAVQETFIALTERPRGDLDSPGAWLRTVATRRACSRLRMRRTRRKHEWSLVGDATPSSPPPEAGGVDVEALDTCIAQLTEQERDLIIRIFYDGETQAEIAALRQVSPVAIHKRLQRTLDRLRVLLAQRGVRIGVPALALFLAGGDRALAGMALAAPRASTLAFALIALAVTLLATGVGWTVANRAQRPTMPAPVAVQPPSLAPIALPAPPAPEPRATLWPKGMLVGGGIPGRYPLAPVPHEQLMCMAVSGMKHVEGPLGIPHPIADCPYVQPTQHTWDDGSTTIVLDITLPPGTALVFGAMNTAESEAFDTTVVLSATDEPQVEWSVRHWRIMRIPDRGTLMLSGVPASSDRSIPPWESWTWHPLREKPARQELNGMILKQDCRLFGTAFRIPGPTEVAELVARHSAPQGGGSPLGMQRITR